jgi:hypothetical protein
MSKLFSRDAANFDVFGELKLIPNPPQNPSSFDKPPEPRILHSESQAPVAKKKKKRGQPSASDVKPPGGSDPLAKFNNLPEHIKQKIMGAVRASK